MGGWVRHENSRAAKFAGIKLIFAKPPRPSPLAKKKDVSIFHTFQVVTLLTTKKTKRQINAASAITPTETPPAIEAGLELADAELVGGITWCAIAVVVCCKLDAVVCGT